MKKLKQLSLILLLSVGLFSCEAEKADPEITNEYLEGKQIFRYTMDGKPRVTSDVSVSTIGSRVIVEATFNDSISNYKDESFTISLSKLATGSYISSFQNILSNETIGSSNATYKPTGQSWSYSTDNFNPEIAGSIPDMYNANFETGNFTVYSINDKAKYFEGSFRFDLYAPKNQNPNNTIAPKRVRDGYLQYVKYD